MDRRNPENSFGESTTVKRVNKLIDQKWRFLPFLAELEAAPKEYTRSMLWSNIVIDGLQVLSLAVAPQHEWGSAMESFTVVLNFVQIPIHRLGTSTSFIICLAWAIVVLLIHLSFFSYMAFRCFLMKRYVAGASTYNSRLFRLYRHLLYLFSSILFLPTAQNYLSIAYRSTTTDTLLWFDSVTSNSALGNTSLAVCVIGLFLHMGAGLMMWTLCMETSYNSQHPLARSNSTPDVIFLLFRFICCVLYNQFWCMQTMLGYGIWMFLGSAAVLTMFILTLPFYSEVSLRIRITLLWLCTVYSILSVCSHIPPVTRLFHKNYHVDLIIFFATLPFFVIVFFKFACLLRVSSTYKASMKAMRDGVLSHPIVYFPKNLPRYPHLFSQNRFVLETLEARSHQRREASHSQQDLDPEMEKELVARREYEREERHEEGGDPEWQEVKRLRYALQHYVMPYIDYIMFESDIELSARFLRFFGNAFPMDLSGYQLRYAAVLYIKGLHRYETSGSVHLAYIHFLIDQAQQYSVAINEMQLLERRELSIAVSYRLWKLEVEVTKGLQIGISNRLSALSNAKEMHAASLQRVVELWHELAQESRQGENKAIDSNRALMRTRSTARQDYENLIYNQPGNLEVLCCYSVFCDHLLDDKDMSNQCAQFVRQFVLNREKNRMQGTRIQASLSAAVTQLKLSLENSRRSYRSVKNRSNVRYVNFFLILLCVLVVALVTVVLVSVVVKQRQVIAIQTSIFRMGQIRTLSAQIGLVSTNIYYDFILNVHTDTSTLKLLYSYLYDYSTLYNSVMFGKKARTSSYINQFFHDQSAGVFQSQSYNLWTYFGLSLAAMNDLLSQSGDKTAPGLKSNTEWLSNVFPSEMNLASTLTVNMYIAQMHKDLDLLIALGASCLGIALLLEIAMFALLFYALFYVEGVRSLVFSLMNLVPKNEIRLLYRRVLNQHSELDVYMKMTPQEKVQRLIAVAGDSSVSAKNQTTTGLLLRNIFAVVPSGKGDGRFITRAEKLQEEQERNGGAPSEESEGGELSFAASSAARYSVDDCLNHNEDDQDIHAIHADIDAEEEESMKDLIAEANNRPGSTHSAKHRSNKRSKNRASIQIATKSEYETVVSQQAYLLSNDKNTVERIFTPLSLVFFAVIFLILVALAVLNLVANSKVSNVQDYNKQEVNKHRTYARAVHTIIDAVLAVGLFAVSKEQRYFKKYIAAQSSQDWQNYRSQITSMQSSSSDDFAQRSFELETLYSGLFAVTDIVMALLCGDNDDRVCQTNVPFEQLYISSLTWDNEPSLYMIQVAPKLGEYKTFFNVLQGSTTDRTESADVRLGYAKTILESSVFNTYFTNFLSKMSSMDVPGRNSSRTTIKICTILSIALGSVGVVLVALEFFYQYRRKRGGRFFPVQVAISAALAGLFIASIVVSCINLKKSSAVNIDKYLNMARVIFDGWAVPLFHLNWNPIMYILSDGQILWCYNLVQLLSTYSITDFFAQLEKYSHYAVPAADKDTLSSIRRLPMIATVLTYEATKNDPTLAVEVEVFDASYLDSFTWDFSAEPDYVKTLAEYHIVTDGVMYSTRASDVNGNVGEMKKLASATLASFRNDYVMELLFSALLNSDQYLVTKYTIADDTAEQQLNLFMYVFYFCVVQAVILIGSNVDLFIRYCINLVSMKHVSAVTVGSEVSENTDTEARKDGTARKPTAGTLGAQNPSSPRLESPASPTAGGGENFASTSEVHAGDDTNNIEIKNANESVTSNVLADQNRSIMENVETSSEHKKNKVLTFASFILVLVLIVLTVVALILLPIYSTHVLQYEKLIDESSQRRWMVVDTFNSMTKINRDKSSYGVVSEELRQKYDDYITLIYGLYFTKSDRPGQSEYPFVGLETKQDALLFSRNRFYQNQTFLGTSISSTSLDGIQVVTSETNGDDDEDFRASNFYCSYTDMVNYMGYYSRGVGLVSDGQWTDFIRRCFLYDYDTCIAAFSDANDVYQPLLTGLAESDAMFISFVHNSASRYFTLLVLFLVAVIVLVILMYLCLFIPFINSLLQEDADSRMLVKILPTEVRTRYPVFDEVLEGKKMLKETNQLHRVMSNMSRMAIFAIESRQGTIVRFNELSEEMFGYATSDVLGKSFAMLLGEDEHGKPSPQRMTELMRDVHRSCKEGEHELQILMQRRNGQLFMVSARFLTVRLSTGDRVYIAFVEEVADRMRLSTLVKINRAALDMHNDAIIHINSDGIILQANPACTRIFGWEMNELVKQNVGIIMPKHVATYHDEYIKRYLDTRVKKRIDSLSSVEGLHRDGTLLKLGLLVKEVIPPYPSEPTQFVAYLRDCTTAMELERANSVSEVLNVVSPIPLIQVSAKGEVQKLSRSACELLQYKHSELLTHTLPVQHIIPESVDNNPQAGFIQRAQLRGPSSAVAQKRERSAFPAVLTVRQIEYGSGLPYNIFVGYISDISKTLRLEKNGRMTYSVMINGIYPVIVMDKTGVINFFNNAAVKCFGYEPVAVIGKSYRMLCPDDVDEDDGGTKDWMRGEGGTSFESSVFNRRRVVYAKRCNGETFPAELVMSEVPPINENDAAVVAILRELSDEIKMKRNYHMSELIDLLCPQGVVVVDSNGHIERFSPAGEDCFGYHAGEVMGAPIQTIIPGIKAFEHRDRESSRRRSRLTEERMESTTASRVPASALPPIKGEVARIEDMVGHHKTNILGRHFDTRSIHLMIHTAALNPIYQNGEKSYVLYCENISNDGELRDASVFYRRIRDAVDSPLIRVDDTGRIVFANHYAALLFGYSSETNIVGKSVSLLFSQSAVEGVLNRLREHVKDFQSHRTNSGMATQQEEGGRTVSNATTTYGTQSPVRMIIQNEVMAGLSQNGKEIMVTCSVVQVSSFLNGTISFIFYVEKCDEHVHEQVAAQTNLLLVGLSTLPMMVVDARGTILHTSEYGRQLLGYNSLEEVVGLNVSAVTNTDCVRLLDEYAIHATSPRASLVRKCRVHGRKQNGQEFQCEMEYRVVGLETDQPVILMSIKSLQQEAEKNSTSTVVNTMLELIGVPSIIINFKGVVTHINASMLTLFGYGEKDADLLIGKDVGALMMDSEAKYHHRYISNYFQSRVKYSIDNTIVRQVRHRDGHGFFVNTTVREISGASKDFKDTMFIGFMTPAPDPKDEQDRVVTGEPIKKGEVTLKRESIMPVERSGRMVRSLEHWVRDENGIAFALLGKMGEVMRLSRAAERLLGYAPGEANGKSLSTVLAADSYGQVAENEIERAVEMMATKSNTVHALHVKAASRRGETLFLDTIWRDLSELRTKILKDWAEMPYIICYLHNRSEQLSATHNKLLCDAAVESCRHPTIFMGEDGIVKLFNAAAEKCFGFSNKEVVGRNVRMLMPRKTAEMHDRFIQTYLTTNVPHIVNRSREVTARRADGSRFSAMLRVRDVHQPTTRFFIGQVEDITNRKSDEVFATMSRLLLKQTDDGLLVFDAHNTLIMVSPAMVSALGYDRESAILSQQNIIDQIFTPSTAKIYREFVQPYQRSADGNALSDTLLLQNFSSALQSLDECPHKQIASAPLRLRQSESSVVVDVDVQIAMCGELFIGTVVRISFPKTADLEQFRIEAASLGNAKFCPQLLCVVGRNGRVEHCSRSLADQLGYEDLGLLELAVLQKPFWTTFPSFPPPQNAANLEEEARMFTSTMQQVASAVNTYNRSGGNRNKRGSDDASSTCPVLRARMQDGSTIVLQIAKVTPILQSEPEGVAKFDSPSTNSPLGPRKKRKGTKAVPEVAYFIVELLRANTMDDAVAKELERAVEPLLNSAPFPMLICDDTGIITHFNKALETTFDFGRDQLEGRSINILMPRRVAEMHDRYLADYRTARETRALVESRQVMGESRTGQPIPLQINLKDVTISGSRCLVATLMPLNSASVGNDSTRHPGTETTFNARGIRF